jgi:hypothetical protein
MTATCLHAVARVAHEVVVCVVIVAAVVVVNALLRTRRESVKGNSRGE